jgi:hypothetical protein
MAFDRIKQVVSTLIGTATPNPTPAAIVSVPAAGTTPVVTSTDTLDAAVAGYTGGTGRVDLVTIKVNGMTEAKANAVWLTKGKDRTQPATAVRLVDCTSDHLKNILINKPDLSDDYRRVIESILEDRGEILPSNDTTDDFNN